MTIQSFKKTKLALGLLGTAALVATPDETHAYDMDCKVILCIAGGFPSGCSDAYSYMIKRITRFPEPLPPFGFCAMSDGSEYKSHKVTYSYLSGQNGYDCPEGNKLYYRRDDDDQGDWGKITAFCYTHMTRQQVGWGIDQQWQVTYHGQSPATPVNFQLNITIESSTQNEFKSPLFRINWSTGYVSQRKLR